MTSDDNVRIEITVSSSDVCNNLTGRITSCADGSELWCGNLTKLGTLKSDTTFVCRIEGLKPSLWSPVSPSLYNLEVRCGGDATVTRIGFRKFEMIDGNFFLNGRPIFLRGNAINPPGRGIPEELEPTKQFAVDYIRFLKGMNINIIRIPDNQNWMDACDEEGMMIFAGRYGRPNGGSATTPPADIDQAVERYKNHDLGPFTSHPSMMIYVLSNETPYKGEAGDAYRLFLKRAYDRLIEWDHTRQYICNAGYGLGRSADVYDVHRYWGWYYNTFLTYLNLRDENMWQNEGRHQAVTFTECVGNYTGIDGRFNLCSRTKQPGSQKCWTGHMSEYEQAREATEYQAFVLKNATEMFRRFRSQNKFLSGIMPFTIMFYDWDGVKSFAEMKPKPVAYQYGISYQPVLLSWEMWQYNAKAGNLLSAVAHVVNDDDYGRDLCGARIEWCIENINRATIASGEIKLPDIKYYDTYSRKLHIQLPSSIQTGQYKLKGVILGSDGEVVSKNQTEIFIASADRQAAGSLERAVKLYDPKGTCAKAFDKIGIIYKTVSSVGELSRNDVFVIAEDSWNQQIASQTKALEKFMSKGGRVVCLRQSGKTFDYSWIDANIKPLRISNNDPTYISPEYTYVDGMNINMEQPSHRIFDGISRANLRLWSDYTDYDETKEGFPMVYPVRDGFSMRQVDLSRAVVLANFSRNLTGTALTEVVHGDGSVILSAFDLTARCGIDPVAERLLCNIICYAASNVAPEPYRKVDDVIFWGDFDSEAGIVTGANNGLVVNPYPVVPVERREQLPLIVDERGYHYVGSYGGWNTRPGVQYLPRGRRPFAPFDYTLGGNDLVRTADELCGEGYFVATVPDDAKNMVTLLENNSAETIEISISINGSDVRKYTVAPESQLETVASLPSDRRIKVLFKGDRRTVILKTQFK